MKHDFKMGGTLVDASSSLKSTHCRMFTLVASLSERHWSRGSQNIQKKNGAKIGKKLKDGNKQWTY